MLDKLIESKACEYCGAFLGNISGRQRQRDLTDRERERRQQTERLEV
jgi:hypothetical protein